MAQGRSTKIISMIKWIRTSRLSIKNSLSLTRPLPSKEGTTEHVLRTFTCTPGPESGLDCLMFAIFARERSTNVDLCKPDRPAAPVYSYQFRNNYLTEMCSGSEAGSHLRLIDLNSLNSRLESNKEEEVAPVDPDVR